MKTKLILFLMLIATQQLWSQMAYIQVSGEPGLSVFLNNEFKGKTTTEINGYIIENVSPGNNLIKIVKDKYIPYEETITVKPGEVFSYKVKPFSKSLVTISEQGNTGETEKKASIETGKLIIQSVPIEIKITMPLIEGVTNSPKTKDEWIVDKIPAGNYTIKFSFNQKTIEKTVDVEGDAITNVFVNMLNDDYKVTHKPLEPILDEKKKPLRLDKVQDMFKNIFKDGEKEKKKK